MPLSLSTAEHLALFEALDRSHAIIEFDMSGVIITANDLFLRTMGYELSDIVGRNHAMFVPEKDKHSSAYKQFWASLRAGGFHSGEFLRVARDGREIWLSAIYNAILDENGQPTKIIKLARDITLQHREHRDLESQMQAIHRSHAVIEFDTAGHITDANDNFLSVAGYRLDEIRGKHHRLFVAPEDMDAGAYKRFWDELAAGRHQAGEFKRIGKNGTPFWIRASYSPILDFHGCAKRVVKFALDITSDVERARLHKEAMEAGNTLFREMMDQVGSIAQSIESITRQTRLLALNARIEAARVGDEGRSFSVVASEISSLSDRTAGSANAISDLIRKSSERARFLHDPSTDANPDDRERPLALRAAHG